MNLSSLKRFTAPLLITAILLAAHLSFGILASYRQFVVAVVVAAITELLFARVFRGKWRHLSSAYITGISCAIILRSPALWPYALAAALSIGSKYVLQVKGRHIWNPSNFGISAILFLAAGVTAPLSVQWGNNIWPMLIIWVIGAVIIWRINRFHICATYVVSFFLFAGLRSWMAAEPFLAEVAPITGPMYQLFVFFMITDPKTTVSAKWGQYAVPFAIAALESVFRSYGIVAAPFYALFFVGPVAMLIEIYAAAPAKKPASAGIE